MAANSSHTVINLLNGNNYPTWKVQCQMALMKDGLWDIVNGTEVRPHDDERAMVQFNKSWNKALATIVLSVDPSLLYLIGEPNSPIEVWRKLSNQFQKKTWANKLHLRKKLYSLKLKDGESVQEHIKVMTETFNELSIIGDPISDEDRVVHVLASLPDSYSMLVTAMEACPDVPKMETVTERLLHEERKRNNGDNLSGNNGDKAMFAKRQRPVSKGPQCYKCHKFGHIKRDCPLMKDNKKRPENKNKGKFQPPHKANNAHASRDSSDSECDYFGLSANHVLLVSDSISNKSWIIDSGASCHMCNDKSQINDFTPFSSPQDVTVGDGYQLQAVGRGSVLLKVEVPHDKSKTCKLNDVLYVPTLSHNLLSVSKATSNIKSTVFTNTGCEFVNAENKVVATGNKIDRLYYLNCSQTQQAAVAQNGSLPPEKLWHSRYGHLGMQNMRKLVNEDMVIGITDDMKHDIDVCGPCAEGKMHRTKFPKQSENRNDSVLGLIHSDVCGKMKNQSLGGGKYFVTFIDDKTRYTWVYIIKSKDEVFEKFLEFKAQMEMATGNKVKALRDDNGGEYKSHEFERYLKQNGIRHELTVPKNPEQNGVAERMNRTIVETARCMLVEAKLPSKFWAEAVSTAVYLRNRSPTTAVKGMTPFESLTGKKPHVEKLRVFGCQAYAHIPKDERHKFDSKARKCIFLGYGENTKGYRLYDIERKKIMFSRDVIFDESKPGIEFEKESTVQPEDKVHFEDHEEPDVDNVEPLQQQPPRVRRPPDRYGEWVHLTRDTSEPSTFGEAVSSQNRQKWQEAMECEIESLRKHNVWELVPLPKGRKLVGSKWVFKTKVNPEGETERYKARLVAQGFSQKYGDDYDETFSPVVRSESIRSLIAVAAKKNLVLHQMDVTTAFLNGNLEEEVYMKQPEGFVKSGEENLVCKLSKSLYGLKQSPRCWNTALDSYLRSLKLMPTDADPCMYTSTEGETVLIGVYVDDIIIATETTETMTEVKRQISQKFEVKDLGQLSSILGVQVKIAPDHIWIGQPGYTTRILEKYGMKDAKPMATPVNISEKLNNETESPPFDPKCYQSAVGSLIYLSNWTRPDITFAVNNVARFCASPTHNHWVAVKRIMRYLIATCKYGISYKKSSTDKVVGYCDADWAGDVVDRKSTSGYIFSLAGAPISWRSKKQSCTALSSAEAEYVALAAASQEVVWLRQLISKIDQPQTEPTVIYDDSQSAIAMTRNPQFHGRAKHIDIKYHYIRGEINKGTVNLVYCPTDDMTADLLTKGLGKEKHNKFVKLMNISTC